MCRVPRAVMPALFTPYKHWLFGARFLYTCFCSFIHFLPPLPTRLNLQHTAEALATGLRSRLESMHPDFKGKVDSMFNCSTALRNPGTSQGGSYVKSIRDGNICSMAKQLFGMYGQKEGHESQPDNVVVDQREIPNSPY